MCGICGIINYNSKNADERLVRAMMKPISHRGPDDEGLYVSGSVGFGFKRLSILDLSPAGHQPMHDSSGRFTIVFNGEIYNYIEIRKRLKGKGYQFRSGTDTEVLLKAFMEWDLDCLDKLNGMFAFAINDKQKARTIIVRDRFGIKPLYYHKNSGQFFFSSEIPSILAILEPDKISPHRQAIFDYLAFNRTDQTENTFFEDIKKLQHGHYICIDNRGMEVKRWYNLSNKLGNPFNNAKEYRQTFSSSVGLRLRSDVPVGACLSGGLDSSSIVSTLIKDYEKYDLNTFSAVYGKGKSGDESEFIDLYNNDLPNMYYTTPTGQSLLADMDEFLTVHAEPLPSTSPYAQFKVMQLAKKHVVVTLDGQGADEQLGGYHYFFGNYLKELLNNLKLSKLASEGYHYLKKHQSIYGLKTFIFFLLSENLKTKARSKNKGYINNHFANAYAADNIIASRLYDSKNLQEAFINHFEYKLEHLLKWDDRNSMWFSLESRVPFLDHRLVERTLALSSNQIINKGETKHILREAMKGTLPQKIHQRQDKIGFVTAEDEWFREDNFKKFISDIIYSEKFNQRGLFDIDKVQNLFQKHQTGQINISKDIWKWINLELWFRKYIDKL